MLECPFQIHSKKSIGVPSAAAKPSRQDRYEFLVVFGLASLTLATAAITLSHALNAATQSSIKGLFLGFRRCSTSWVDHELIDLLPHQEGINVGDLRHGAVVTVSWFAQPTPQHHFPVAGQMAWQPRLRSKGIFLPVARGHHPESHP